MLCQSYPATCPPKRRFWSPYFCLLLGLFLFLPSTSRSVNAQTTPPSAFGKLIPLNNATGVASPVTLRWTPSTDATYYTYCIDTTDNLICDAGVNNTGYTQTTATSVTLILATGHTYYWQVSAHNSLGQIFADDYLVWHSFTTSPLPVDFHKVVPINGATNLPTDVTFAWELQSTNISDYRICYDTIENFACDHPDDWQPIKADSATFTLVPNTQYYWQLREYNEYGYTAADGESGWHTFTTGDGTIPTPTLTPTPVLPGAFHQVSPWDGATDVPNPVTLRWDPSVGAEEYSFCITQRRACDVGYFGTGDGKVGNQTEATLMLLPGTTFWWRVRASNANGATAAATRWISFTTTLNPIAVNKSFPADDMGGVFTDTTLRWIKAPFVTDYRVCYDMTHNETCDAGDDGWIPLGETTTYMLNGLEPNTVYSWQVRTYNIHGFTDADQRWFRFRTGPGPLAKTAPMDKAVNITQPVTLQWTPAIGATEYGYCIDETNNNGCDLGPIHGYKRTPSTSAILTALKPNTTYYWHARAYNQFGDFTPANGPGMWYSFTTAADELEYAPDPIPGDSINVGPPPDGSGALCCIGGYVYLDGKPVISPTVLIYTPTGHSLQADIRSTGLYHYFSADLNTPELAIQVGDVISLTAAVSGTGYTRLYTVEAGVQQVDIIIPSQSGYRRPVATIKHSSHIGVIDTDEVLLVQGSGQDSDSSMAIAGYDWTVDGAPISSSDTLQINARELKLGHHTIALRVQDREGEWSLPVRLSLKVVEGWTMLIYFDGDSPDANNHYFGKILKEIGEQEAAGTLPQGVNVAILRDGPSINDTEWITFSNTGTSRQNFVIDRIVQSQEVDMNDPETLTNFVKWGQNQFPNTHYYLSIADHGQAIAGIAWDETFSRTLNGPPSRPVYLRTREIDNALADPTLQKLDILHLDACSMNTIETAYELRQVADYLISSQFLTWNTFVYQNYINNVQQEMAPSDFARTVAQTYSSSVQALRKDPLPFTISVLDLRYTPLVHNAIADLAQALNGEIGKTITLDTLSTVRNESQIFESENEARNYAHETQKDFYVDVADWTTQLLKTTSQPVIQTKGEALLNLLTAPEKFVVFTQAHSGTMLPKHQSAYIDLDRASGLSIFYPVEDPHGLVQHYIRHNLFDFTRESNWPEFLQAGGLLGQSDPLGPLPQLVAPLEAPLTENATQIFLPIVTH